MRLSSIELLGENLVRFPWLRYVWHISPVYFNVQIFIYRKQEYSLSLFSLQFFDKVITTLAKWTIGSIILAVAVVSIHAKCSTFKQLFSALSVRISCRGSRSWRVQLACCLSADAFSTRMHVLARRIAKLIYFMFFSIDSVYWNLKR